MLHYWHDYVFTHWGMSNTPVVISQKKSYSASLSSNQLPVIYLVGLGTQWSLLDPKWDILYSSSIQRYPIWASPHLFSFSLCHALYLWVTFSFLTTTSLKLLLEKGCSLVHVTAYHLQESGQELKEPSQELKQNHGQMLLAGLFSITYLACFVIRPRALAHRGHHTHQVLPHQLLIKNKSPTDLSTYQSDVKAEAFSFASWQNPN